MATFTQKHYEYLERALRERRATHLPRELDAAIEILRDIFAEDNPKFKRDVFMKENENV